MTRTIVILGSSYAGIEVGHYLLKYTNRAVKDLKVILVNPSTHFFWNMGAVRAIVPGQIEDDAILREIPGAFIYAKESFEFVVGSAENVDVERKIVSIATASGSRTQFYDILVVTTGSRTIGQAPWKAIGSVEDLKIALHETREKVKNATTIIIGGGGSTGVEMAGELGTEFGSAKEIMLVTSGPTVLTGTALTTSIIGNIEKELEKLHVKILHNTRVNGSMKISTGQTALTTSGGDLLTDLYLQTLGLEANSSFLPKRLLNSKGEVMLDEYFRVKSVKDIWAAGDVGDLQRNGWMITLAQSQHLAKNLDLALKGENPVAYKVPAKDMMVIAIGKNKGTGIASGWKVPGLAAWWFKARTLGIERLPAVVAGNNV